MLWLLVASVPAAAQEPTSGVAPRRGAELAAPHDEARAEHLRHEARRAVSEGRLEEAFSALRIAAEQTREPAVWLELAEVADRLRLDAVARDAYERYLAAFPNAPARAELAGRVRVLRRQLANGGQGSAGEDETLGGPQLAALDAGTRAVLERARAHEPSEPRCGVSVLIDWQGRPLRLRRSSEPFLLARWDGRLHRSRLSPGAEVAARESAGMGRQLGIP